MLKKTLIIFLLAGLIGCNSQSKEDLLKEGVKLSGEGNPSGAVVLFKNALEKDPNYFEARYQLGVAYLKTSKFQKAENEFQKVLLQDPKNPEVLIQLAEIYLNTNRADQAVAEIEKYLSTASKTSKALDLMGRAQAQAGNAAKSEALFREAMALNPGDLDPALGLAQLLGSGNRFDEARSVLEDLVQKFPENTLPWFTLARIELAAGQPAKALELYRKIAEIAPSNIEARYMAGAIALDLGDVESGLALAAQLKTQFPEHPVGARLKGMALYRKGDFSNALVELQNSVKGMPDLIGYYFLGLSYTKLEQFELALNQFQKALSIQPGHQQSRLMVATTLFQQKRFDDCISETIKVLDQSPENGYAYNLRGNARMAKGEFDQAMEDFDKAIALDPSLAEPHLKKGLFNLAKGNAGLAEADLVKALQVEPGNLNSRLLLASYYLRQQNFNDALSTLKKGLAQKPEDAMVYNYMASALFSQKKPAEAVEALNKAKAVKPDYFAPYFNLAGYYAATSEPNKALDEYRGVLKVDAQNIQAHLRLAAQQELMGDKAGALAAFEGARQTGKVEGFLALAGYQMRSGAQDKALEILKEAYGAHPGDSRVLEVYGEFLVRKNLLPEAFKVFEQLDLVQAGKGTPYLISIHLRNSAPDKAIALAQSKIDEAPDKPFGYLLMASVQARLDHKDKAEAILKKGIETVRENIPLRMELAASLTRKGDSASAIKIYEAIEVENPRFVPASFALGTLHDIGGDKKLALKKYKEVLAKAENYTPALNNLAYLYAENYGDLKEALDLALRAYRTSPSEPSVMDTLGYVLTKNGKAQEAVPLLEKASELLPEVAGVRLHLAQAYKGAGQIPEAKKQLQVVVDKGSESEIDAARKLLSELK